MTGPTARVVAIVLNYDDSADTLQSVQSLRRSECRDLSIVVVDNNPSPTAQNELRDQLGPHTDYLPTGSNIGYAAGNNIGIKHALRSYDPEFVWIVNPDVRVNRTTLGDMLTVADLIPDAGVLGPRIFHGGSQPPRIWFDGGIIDEETFGNTSHRGSGVSGGRESAPSFSDTDYVTGACMLVRVTALLQGGLIPEDYFLYFEETDYCRHLDSIGWRLLVVHSATADHFKRSSGLLPQPHYVYYMVRNRLTFARRHFGEESIARADEAFNRTFVEPWRDRLLDRAPELVTGFDRLVASARADAQRGLTGKSEVGLAF